MACKAFKAALLRVLLVLNFLYPFASDRLTFLLYSCSLIFSGGIIVLMYFTNLSTKFKYISLVPTSLTPAISVIFMFVCYLIRINAASTSTYNMYY